jgi:hypothetical protein
MIHLRLRSRLLVIGLSTLLSPVELGWSQPSLFGFGQRFKNRVGHRSGRLAPGARSPRAGSRAPLSPAQAVVGWLLLAGLRVRKVPRCTLA